MNNTMFGFESIVWFKEKGNPWIQETPQMLNRGFLFGDGLFETMAFLRGKIRFSEMHWERLTEGCGTLGLDSSTLTSIPELEKLLAEKFGTVTDLRIRWNVFRNGLGKYTPETDMISEVLQIQAFALPVKIKKNGYISDSIQVPFSPWSHCKTLNALTYVMANRERRQKEMDEVILLSTDGFVSEAGAANVFWLKNHRFYTPSLACGGIAGVARKIILNKLNALQIPIVVDAFRPEAILEADKVFTSNVTGISYLERIGDSVFEVSPIDFLESLFGQP
ncbi:aminotransferase class IV [Rhodonellum sp.]|uniref:aminotransferase class IV n=1 Tax=Rhodonellum sp. TaxID=2231180 RepID=UPI002726106F|nr:aminotransferase class IV [Rhodonellum sp.]MDO9550919.1 aminotransferase class IV [Rhodonellum sp.]